MIINLNKAYTAKLTYTHAEAHTASTHKQRTNNTFTQAQTQTHTIRKHSIRDQVDRVRFYNKGLIKSLIGKAIDRRILPFATSELVSS